MYISNTYASGIVSHPEAGGIIGSINANFRGHTIHVQYSVYNNEEEGKLVGSAPIGYPDMVTGKSNDLDDIRGQLYHYNGDQQWDNGTWVINGTDELPILRFQLTDPVSLTLSCPSSTPSPSPSVTVTPTTSMTPFPTDLRNSIIDGNEACFEYIPADKLFFMNCSVLDWQAHYYGPDTHISLGVNETFDGSGGSSEEYIIDLSSITKFKGMFKIHNDVVSLAEAPVIKNVHVRNGTVAEVDGFIVRGFQKYFTVDSCSSTGEIANRGAGGICGRRCGQHNGETKISNSYSTGRLTGSRTGGIAGDILGFDSGVAHITGCYSSGEMEGYYGGGICGTNAGGTGGSVYVIQSYSTGDISSNARDIGGIVGDVPVDIR